MRIVELDGHGGPEVLQLGEAPVPSQGDTEILVRIAATSVTAGDVALRRQALGRFLLFWPVARLFFGIKNQRKKVLGHEFSGVVEARGASVRRFEVGDAVFGTTGFRGGAYAEYVCVDQDDVVCAKPENLSFEEAAVLPIGGQVALFFLKQAEIQPDDRVLIHGASGSIGTYAVQIAAHLGAHVTGVCSTPNLELVASLGAEQTIDDLHEEIDGSDKKYDVGKPAHPMHSRMEHLRISPMGHAGPQLYMDGEPRHSRLFPQESTVSPSPNARLVGLLVLPLLFIGPFALMWVPEQVHVAGDAAATAAALAAHADVFRLGLVGELAIAFTEVAMVIALYRLFRSGGEGLSQAAAVARGLMIALMGGSIVAGLTALAVLPAAPDLVLPLMEVRRAISATWEAFFALHLGLLAVVVHNSGLVPRAFGPMLFVAGAGYALNSLAVLAFPALIPTAAMVVGVTAMLGEVPLFLWLLVKGTSTPRAAAAVDGRRVAV